ncbi:MAG: type II secretion system protein GspG [Puniceicoccales bacterium]|nr:type II secretion system protein GspG [Puniceicoccales bacterium]
MNFGSRFRRGFTFLELSSTILIIVVCVVLFRVVYSYRSDSIKDNMTKEELALLNCVIEDFKSRNGSYPVCASQMVASNAKELYKNLEQQINAANGGHKWRISDNMIMDPWGNPYAYRCLSSSSTSYKLLSMGQNGHIDEPYWVDDIHSRPDGHMESKD